MRMIDVLGSTISNANIKHVCIENFKSIDKLEFSPKRINILLGDSGAGKTNILETFKLSSWPHGILKCPLHVNFIEEAFFYKHLNDIKINFQLEVDFTPPIISVDFSFSFPCFFKFNMFCNFFTFLYYSEDAFSSSFLGEGGPLFRKRILGVLEC